MCIRDSLNFPRSWDASGLKFLPLFRPFSYPKVYPFSHRVVDVVFFDFGVPTPPRLSSRLHETLKTKTRVFHFWPHFACILASKMDAKSFQNASKKPTKNQMSFALKNSRTNGPHPGVQGGSNEPAFHSQNSVWDPLGTPRGARGPPEGPHGRFLTDFWTDFMICWSFLNSFFLWFPTHFQIKKWSVLQLAHKYLIEELLNASRNQLKYLTNFHKKYH